MERNVDRAKFIVAKVEIYQDLLLTLEVVKAMLPCGTAVETLLRRFSSRQAIELLMIDNERFIW